MESPPITRPAHWDEDTWAEARGEDGYDGWWDCGEGTYWLSGRHLPPIMSIHAQNVFEAIEAMYERYPESRGQYIEVESWSS